MSWAECPLCGGPLRTLSFCDDCGRLGYVIVPEPWGFGIHEDDCLERRSAADGGVWGVRASRLMGGEGGWYCGYPRTSFRAFGGECEVATGFCCPDSQPSAVSGFSLFLGRLLKQERYGDPKYRRTDQAAFRRAMASVRPIIERAAGSNQADFYFADELSAAWDSAVIRCPACGADTQAGDEHRLSPHPLGQVVAIGMFHARCPERSAAFSRVQGACCPSCWTGVFASELKAAKEYAAWERAKKQLGAVRGAVRRRIRGLGASNSPRPESAPRRSSPAS